MSASNRAATAERATFHWPEYAIEGAALGAFMMAAAICATALYHPSSRLAASIDSEWLRRSVMGLAMGLTAVAIIYSPWGQRSGAHMNPAVTLTFYRLGKVPRPDAVAYVAAQFVGGALGLAVASAALGGLVSHPAVNYIVTMPGPGGITAAFVAEASMSFALMFAVLLVSNRPPIARFTGLCAGLLVFVYITLEAPVSGMSINPARTLGSALVAGNFTALWLYFVAPPLGMLMAAEFYVRRVGLHRVMCAKLHHPHGPGCIFGCDRRMGSPAPM